MTTTLYPDTFMTPHRTKTDLSSSSPPSVPRRIKNRIDRSIYTDADTNILSRLLLPSLDFNSPKSSFRLDLQQRLSHPGGSCDEEIHSFSLSKSSSGSASRYSSLSYPHRRSLTNIGQGKMTRRQSGNALAA